MEKFYTTAPASSSLNMIMLFGHHLSATDDGVYFSYGYTVHRRPWWKPWADDRIEVQADVVHNGIVLRHWTSADPAVIECYFEDPDWYELDSLDEKWLTDYFLDWAKAAYYHGLR